MHITTAAFLSSLLGLASSAPLYSSSSSSTPSSSPYRRGKTTTHCTLSSSTGFRLRAAVPPSNATAPPSFPVDGRYLATARVSQGVEVSVLEPWSATSSNATTASAPPPPPPVWYLNRTSSSSSPDTNLLTDIPGVYPLALSIAPAFSSSSSPSSSPSSSEEEHSVGAVVDGSPDAGILRLSSSASNHNSTGTTKPQLSGPGGGTAAGTYAACRRAVPVGGEEPELTTLVYVYANETVPGDCAPVALVAECAELPPLPAGSQWGHQGAVTVDCVA
ncbi:hypothetical protein F4780DRAFT_782032 [Xylariomycetidae sp. FL0641]|nr:hypothetical protein F4780DRAFT_782032 [Xylariomycetidae sp. FL0641]